MSTLRQSLEQISKGEVPVLNATPCETPANQSFNSTQEMPMAAVATTATAINPQNVRPIGRSSAKFVFTNGTADEHKVYLGTRLGIAGGWLKTYGPTGTSNSSADYALFTDQYGAATLKLQGFNDNVCATPVMVSKISVFTALADNLREAQLEYVSNNLDGQSCNSSSFVDVTNSLNNGVEYDAAPGYFALSSLAGYAYAIPAGKAATFVLALDFIGSTVGFAPVQ